MIKSGLILSAGNGVGALLSLLRNIIIARLISVEDFGIASTLALTIGIVELASQIGIDRLIVQARDGGSRLLCETCQLMQVIRGLLNGAVLLLLAAPIASFFGVPEAAWAYQLLALVPVMRGFIHHDVYRFQRDLNFLPFVMTETVPLLIALVLIFPLHASINDFRLMLYLILGHQAMVVVATHLVAERRYSLGWDYEIFRRALHFGWPLMLNAMVMYIALNGDRLIVGGFIGVYELGLFGAVFGLIMSGGLVVSKTLNQFFLPYLASSRDDPIQYERRLRLTVECCMAAGLIVCCSAAVFGPQIFVSLYGGKYEPAIAFLVWIGIAHSIRITRTAWSVAALAHGRTKLVLVANATRLLVLPLVVYSVLQGGGIVAVLIGSVLAEVLGSVMSLWLVRRKLGQPLGGIVRALVFTALGFALTALDGIFRQPALGADHILDGRSIALLMLIPLSLLAMPELRRKCFQLFSRVGT